MIVMRGMHAPRCIKNSLAATYSWPWKVYLSRQVASKIRALILANGKEEQMTFMEGELQQEVSGVGAQQVVEPLG